jgi:hypothetical protein
MIEMLETSFNPIGKMELGTRKALVYQKLRQQWIRTEISRLKMVVTQETEEEQDG